MFPTQWHTQYWSVTRALIHLPSLLSTYVSVFVQPRLQCHVMECLRNMILGAGL